MPRHKEIDLTSSESTDQGLKHLTIQKGEAVPGRQCLPREGGSAQLQGDGAGKGG